MRIAQKLDKPLPAPPCSTADAKEEVANQFKSACMCRVGLQLIAALRLKILGRRFATRGPCASTTFACCAWSGRPALLPIRSGSANSHTAAPWQRQSIHSLTGCARYCPGDELVSGTSVAWLLAVHAQGTLPVHGQWPGTGTHSVTTDTQPLLYVPDEQSTPRMGTNEAGCGGEGCWRGRSVVIRRTGQPHHADTHLHA